MPRDRAACDKAVREAWKRERELVLEGKGTRDWTEDEQLEIIELGKVFDTDGTAYAGQHMKSVAAYPEHQGNPDNIQLLSVSEHFAAHKGNWQNQTNWYYDPVTFEYNDFGNADPVACMTIELSQPFMVKVKNNNEEANIRDPKEKNEDVHTTKISPEGTSLKQDTPSASTSGYTNVRKKGFWARVWEGVKYYGEKGVDWVIEHPGETVLIVVSAIGAAITGHKVYKRHKSNSSEDHIYVSMNETLSKQTKTNSDLMKVSFSDFGERLEENISHSEKIVDVVKEQIQDNESVIIDNLNKCSDLYILGYTTKKSLEERRMILDSFVDTDGAEKARRLLQFLINTRSTMKNGIYEKSVSKWQEDLDYLSGK